MPDTALVATAGRIDPPGMPADGRYVVVALAGGTARGRAAARERWRHAGRRTHWHVRSELEHGIVLLDATDHDVAGRPDVLPDGVRAGISLPVRGLASVAEARRRAETALSLCPTTGGSVHLAEHLPAALVLGDPTLAAELVARVLGPLDPASADHPLDGDVLLTTFAAWVTAGGSARSTAAALGCHRNTVTNRLRRLERYTRRRLDRPGDLADLVLALRVRTGVRVL